MWFIQGGELQAPALSTQTDPQAATAKCSGDSGLLLGIALVALRSQVRDALIKD